MARLEKVVSDTNVVSRSSHGHPVELLAVLELAGAAVGPEMHVLESATLRSEPRLVLRDEDVHGVLDEGVGVLEIRRDEHVRPAWFNTKLSTEGGPFSLGKGRREGEGGSEGVRKRRSEGVRE